MKKFIFALCALFMLGSYFNVETVSAKDAEEGLSKSELKDYKKLSKTRAKELTKAGWVCDGESKTLEATLFEHYKRMAEEGLKEQTGVCDKSKKRSIGVSRAIWNAQTTYVSEMSADIKGRTGSITNVDDDIESDKFYEAFEKCMRADVSGLFDEPSYIISRKKGKDYEFRVVYLYNKAKAAALKKSALENAAKEVQMSKAVINEISKFIEEGQSE